MTVFQLSDLVTIIILGLACSFVTILATRHKCTDFIRNFSSTRSHTKAWPGEVKKPSKGFLHFLKNKINGLFSCPFCFSWWLALSVVLLFLKEKELVLIIIKTMSITIIATALQVFIAPKKG